MPDCSRAPCAGAVPQLLKEHLRSPVSHERRKAFVERRGTRNVQRVVRNLVQDRPYQTDRIRPQDRREQGVTKPAEGRERSTGPDVGIVATVLQSSRLVQCGPRIEIPLVRHPADNGITPHIGHQGRARASRDDQDQRVASHVSKRGICVGRIQAQRLGRKRAHLEHQPEQPTPLRRRLRVGQQRLQGFPLQQNAGLLVGCPQ